jgi:hypothetical protein
MPRPAIPVIPGPRNGTSQDADNGGEFGRSRDGGRSREREQRDGGGAPQHGRCKFLYEKYWGGNCKSCVYKCTDWGAPVVYPQAVAKTCPSIRADGWVNTAEIDPICRGKQDCP